MSGIWIIAEKKEHALELLTIGRVLAAQMETKLSAFLWKDQNVPEDYIACGADEIMLAAPGSEGQSLDAFIPVIAAEAENNHPDAILFAATARCRDLAARVASRMNTGLCSSCTSVAYDAADRTIKMERLAYGGAAVQKVICKTRPVMVTIPPGTFEQAKAEAGRTGIQRELSTPAPSVLKVIEKKTKVRETKDITESRVIVAVGRGFDKKEDLDLARKLACALGGEIGCTRPISEENHWLPEELCIGLSGVQVKPDFYLGLGVSGQVQHATGIRQAKVVAAVNKDENAPIFSVADFGIVGNLYDVVPKLLEALKRV
ncbi:MAG: Acryloyl-CoA reductase electron transfer subunit beta [Smithella sp. PtaU1.Bin162]|nr:MAG: Acryloyl-CoA reductase electron transfer subunit beta [Smithella sp. PtaU1.Bin162]